MNWFKKHEIFFTVLFVLLALLPFPLILWYSISTNTKQIDPTVDYIQSEKDFIISLYHDYTKLEVLKIRYQKDNKMTSKIDNEQKIILDRLQQEIKLLDQDQIPAEVQKFINLH